MWKYLSVFLVSTILWSLVISQSQTCTTPLGKKGVCVPLHKCPNSFEQREPNSVVSYVKRSQCDSDGDKPRVCCEPLPPDQGKPATQRPTPRPTQAPGQGNGSYSQEDSSLAPRNQCGADASEDRIYGGESAELHEFPWMALLGYTNRSGITTYQCGGGLINHRYVLTAAHCLVGKYLVKYGALSTVRLGEYDTQNDIDCMNSVCADPPQEFSVASVYPHPGYSDENISRIDDIGIVRLATRAQYNYYVQPICLVDNSDRLKTGDIVHVAGWGKVLNGKKSPIKMKLSLPIFDKNNCVSKFMEEFGALLGENQICAGGVFKEDSCRGDSGGPLMTRRPEGIWEAVGLVSFGYDCGRDGWPAVYTSVSKYTAWINNTLKTTNV